MKYTLSFYVKENQPYIKYPKWFEVWKKSKLVDNYIYIRKICNIEVENYDEAINFFDSEKIKEVIRQTHNEANYLQLEMNGNENTNYIKSSEL